MNVPKQLALGEGFMALTQIEADRSANYGEVFTRRWIVELILDLVGYTSDRDLASLTLVEPSCGTGAFLVPIIDRLIQAGERHGRDLRTLGSALRAFDLVAENAECARKVVGHRLQESGLSERDAEALADEWVVTGDFLLKDHAPASADFVVGNPPYIRLESVPRSVMQAYRIACPTMRGRSDIYVGFIERGLDLLKPDGVLGFICADRWMRNQYGADLRELVTSSYAIETVIAMHDVDAFEDDVSAYPAIVVLRNSEQASVAVVDAKGSFDKADANLVAGWVRNPRRSAITGRTFEASRLDRWFDGRDLWPSGSPAQLSLVAQLEARFPPLEDPATATRVGIGVATGCDDVYITSDTSIVEEDRLLPLLQAGDVTNGSPNWQGKYLVNPWNDEGLVDLKRYGKLRRYFESHSDRLRARHVAQQRPARWYRTIDRVDPKLLGRPKLMLPDLKASAHPVLDEGNYYPHHNLYFVVSDAWDLEVLGGLLLSDVANLFVGAYCVKMRGGCYRFQAQYLRRIRVPDVRSLSTRVASDLATAFRERDRSRATAAAAQAYEIDDPSLANAGVNSKDSRPDPLAC